MFQGCLWDWVAEVEMRLFRNCEAKVLAGLALWVDI